MHSHAQHVSKEVAFRQKVFQRNGKKSGQKDGYNKGKDSKDIMQRKKSRRNRSNYNMTQV